MLCRCHKTHLLISHQLTELYVRKNPNEWILAIDLMASAIKEHFELANIETTKDQVRLADAARWMLAIACVSAGNLNQATATVIDLKSAFVQTKLCMNSRPFRHLAQLELGPEEKDQLSQIRKFTLSSSSLRSLTETFGSVLLAPLVRHITTRVSDIPQESGLRARSRRSERRLDKTSGWIRDREGYSCD